MNYALEPLHISVGLHPIAFPQLKSDDRSHQEKMLDQSHDVGQSGFGQYDALRCLCDVGGAAYVNANFSLTERGRIVHV